MYQPVVFLPSYNFDPQPPLERYPCQATCITRRTTSLALIMTSQAQLMRLMWGGGGGAVGFWGGGVVFFFFFFLKRLLMSRTDKIAYEVWMWFYLYLVPDFHPFFSGYYRSVLHPLYLITRVCSHLCLRILFVFYSLVVNNFTALKMLNKASIISWLIITRRLTSSATSRFLGLAICTGLQLTRCLLIPSQRVFRFDAV